MMAERGITMNDKYEFTETFYNKCQHDIREFRKRIDQLEEENAKLQALIDSAMKPVSEEVQRVIEWCQKQIDEIEHYEGFHLPTTGQVIQRENYKLAIQALKQYQEQKPVSDDLLWQEIFSLREKLKISVEAIKSYDPEFDDKLFMHQLNSVDYEQLMEEFSGESLKQEPKPCDVCSGKKQGDIYSHPTKTWDVGIYGVYCPQCGKTLG